jgi:hypothetical protein
VRALEPRSPIPDTPVPASHSPAKANYSKYRPCLGWEFGFYCGYCWLHESDFNPRGLPASGLMWIEHCVTRSADKSKQNEYANCTYSCKGCNRHRSVTPIRGPGGVRLLHPRSDAWAVHFEWNDHVLQPRTDDARYTAKTYNINSPIKVTLRKLRFEAVPPAREVLPVATAEIARCLSALKKCAPQDRAIHMKELISARQMRDLAWRQISLFQAVPAHARESKCRCGQAPSLPSFALAASSEVPDPS